MDKQLKFSLDEAEGYYRLHKRDESYYYFLGIIHLAIRLGMLSYDEIQELHRRNSELYEDHKYDDMDD